MKKKEYTSPQIVVIEVEQADVICTSTSAFSAPQNIEEGDESVWDEDPNW